MATVLPVSGTPVNVDFDPAKVRQKFAEEREKRLRTEPMDQFQGLRDTVEIDSSDPWTPQIDREPIEEEVEVVVLGGGFGGLLTGAHLRKNGVADLRIIEEAGDFGGTWYWNRYPGVECDVESYMYMPLLEETGYIPTRRFSPGTEVFEHTRRIGRHFELYQSALFHTTVTSAHWLEDQGRWEVRTNRGDSIKARFLLRANGPLSKPQIPRVPGIGSFSGKIMHTTRWDYAYTGGNSAGGLDKLGESGSPSWVPERLAFRRLPIWRGRPSSCMSYNEHRPTSALATTVRRIRSGRRRSRQAGRMPVYTTSSGSPMGSPKTKIW